jgi:hypothetical protein
VHSSCIRYHLRHVGAVLQWLRDRQLHAKPTKGEWMQTEIEFLGYSISTRGLSITTSKRKYGPNKHKQRQRKALIDQ